MVHQVITGWDSLRDLLSWGKEELAALGLRESQTSSEWLLADVLGLDRHELYLEPDRKVSDENKQKYAGFIHARAEHVPTAYVTGKAFFRNEELEVSPACLIPRPETEGMVERFIENSGWHQKDSFSFLDLGTGSGAIGISLLRHFENAQATLSDLSHEALGMARKNIAKYGLKERAEMVLSDLFDEMKGRRWHAILSNPPYLSESDWEKVEPEILSEPRMALHGGLDGFEYYRSLIRSAPDYLYPGGWLVFETGLGQAEPVSRWLRQMPFNEVRCFQDDAGLDRVVMARLG